MPRDPLDNPEPLIRRVYAYVAYRIGAGPDAEDVTGEVFERALRYRRSFDGTKGEPAAWLIGIARRCIDDALSSRRPEGGHAAETAAPGDLEEETIRRITLSAAVDSLDERDRELIALRYGADLPTRDIAKILDLQPNAVDVGLHRARARLSLKLDDAAGKDSGEPFPGPVRT